MPRRHDPMVARVFVLLAACVVFSGALALAWVACSNPLELEVREGSNWLHVIAARAGVDIYDHYTVAFVNMAHGPFDAILKTWISRCIPFLPGHIVARIFVLLTPGFFLVTAYTISRKRLGSALFAAGALYLLLMDVSLLLMVGRSDATAICGLCVAGVLAHQLLVNQRWAWFERPYVLRQGGLGVASAVVFLTLSRYAPAVLAFQFVVALARLGTSTRRYVPAAITRRLRRRLRFVFVDALMGWVLFLSGFGLVWLLTFVIELHADFELYYQHFFGFFSAGSGWGTFPGAKFELFPTGLLTGREAPLSVFVVVLLLGCYRVRRQRLELLGWALMLAATYFTLANAYHKNQLGGGLHYFFPFFVFAWIFVLHALRMRHRWGLPSRLVFVLAIMVALPWKALLDRYELAEKHRAEAREFVEEVARITQGEPIYAESTHLFKASYQGEIVDSGDTVHAIATKGSFGGIFTHTYNEYIQKLRRAPPRFVLEAVMGETPFSGITTPTLTNLIRTRYKRVAMARGSAFTFGGSQALFELRTPPRPNRKRTGRMGGAH